MDRDVQRREALLADALPVLFGEVGQRDEASVQGGVAVVVIFDEEGLAGAPRVLVDEAEGALVPAAPDS